MTCQNVGGTERTVRMVLGVLCLGAAFLAPLPTAGAWIVGAIGGIAVVTGAIGFCPAWTLFGINTCSTK